MPAPIMNDHYVTIAYELGYSVEVREKISKAKSEDEIRRIMKSAREEMARRYEEIERMKK